MTERLFSLGNPWFRAAAGATLLVAIGGALAGFIWFPSVEGGSEGLWQAICSAAGLTRSQPAPVKPTESPGSTVVLAGRSFASPDPVSIGRGATLAHECAICHGTHRANQVDTPDLAGQPASMIYKELQDFRSGARVSAVMSPQAANLSDQDVQDLAAYFAYLPPQDAATAEAPGIVATGAPMRNIPPCEACHGGMETKAGAPRLDGESVTYIHNQLTAFADGTRRNDIGQQMRNIARRMTPAEIEAAARYYASGRNW